MDYIEDIGNECEKFISQADKAGVTLYFCDVCNGKVGFLLFSKEDVELFINIICKDSDKYDFIYKFCLSPNDTNDETTIDFVILTDLHDDDEEESPLDDDNYKNIKSFQMRTKHINMSGRQGKKMYNSEGYLQFFISFPIDYYPLMYNLCKEYADGEHIRITANIHESCLLNNYDNNYQLLPIYNELKDMYDTNIYPIFCQYTDEFVKIVFNTQFDIHMFLSKFVEIDQNSLSIYNRIFTMNNDVDHLKEWNFTLKLYDGNEFNTTYKKPGVIHVFIMVWIPTSDFKFVCNELKKFNEIRKIYDKPNK